MLSGSGMEGLVEAQNRPEAVIEANATDLALESGSGA